MNKLTYLAAAALMTSLSANATTYFCSPEGSGEKDGSSWDNTYPAANISSILSFNLTDGDEVYFTEGTYKGDGTQLLIPAGVLLKGGYSATNPTGTYNCWTNKTIFDADGKNADTDANNAAFIKITTKGENPNLIAGITITGCVGGTTSTYCGTALNCTGSYVILENVVFDNNKSKYGGVVAPAGGSQLHAKSCVWSNNQNESSTANACQSALSVRGTTSNLANVVLERCVFVNNTSTKTDATYGGLMSCQDDGANLAMINCYIDGGGRTISQNGGLMRTGKNRTFVFAFNTFFNAGTTHGTEAKGHLLSLNGGSNIAMVGNLFLTDKVATENDDKLNNAVFFQSTIKAGALTTGGYNLVTGTLLGNDIGNSDIDFRSANTTDNWLAPAYTSVLASDTESAYRKATGRNGLNYKQPTATYKDVDLETAKNAFTLPDCFSFANVDLSLDVNGYTRGATTYRGAYDPDAMVTTGVGALTADRSASTLAVSALGKGEFAVSGATGLAQVYDMAGRLVYSSRLADNGVLSLSHLAAGVYVVRVANSTVKIIK